MGKEEEARLLFNENEDKIKKDSKFFNFIGIRYLREGILMKVGNIMNIEALK